MDAARRRHSERAFPPPVGIRGYERIVLWLQWRGPACRIGDFTWLFWRKRAQPWTRREPCFGCSGVPRFWRKRAQPWTPREPCCGCSGVPRFSPESAQPTKSKPAPKDLSNCLLVPSESALCRCKLLCLSAMCRCKLLCLSEKCSTHIINSVFNGYVKEQPSPRKAHWDSLPVSALHPDS